MTENDQLMENEFETHKYRPYAELPNVLNDETRHRLAEDLAKSRHCVVSPHLRQIFSNPHPFYHLKQQSALMMLNFEHRKLLSYEMMREAAIKQKIIKNEPLPAKIPMIEINPNRITLSMECESQYYLMLLKSNDNSESISSIMYKTNTIIQLPDHSTDEIDPFAQQICITGEYKNVERARVLLREHCPVVVNMPIPNCSMGRNYLHELIVKKIIRYPEIDAECISTNPSDIHIRLACAAKYEPALRNMCEELVQAIFNKNVPKNVFTLTYGISTYHIDHIVRKPNSDIIFMEEIEKQSNAKITYPEYHCSTDFPHSIFPVRVEGSIDEVLNAKQLIQELMPISICFNISDSQMSESIRDEKLRRSFHLDEILVHIRVVPSVYEPKKKLSGEEMQHCVSIRTKEFNVRNMYKSYGSLLLPSLGINTIVPTEYDNSFWLNEYTFDREIMLFDMPCRGEAPSNKRNGLRNRSRSTSKSGKSKIKKSSNIENPIQIDKNEEICDNKDVQLNDENVSNEKQPQQTIPVRNDNDASVLNSQAVPTSAQIYPGLTYSGIPPNILYQHFKHPTMSIMNQVYVPPNFYFFPQEMMNFPNGQVRPELIAGSELYNNPLLFQQHVLLNSCPVNFHQPDVENVCSPNVDSQIPSTTKVEISDRQQPELLPKEKKVVRVLKQSSKNGQFESKNVFFPSYNIHRSGKCYDSRSGDEDSKSTTRSVSRRTSISGGDDPTIGSYEGFLNERNYPIHRAATRTPVQSQWKQRNHGDSSYVKRGNSGYQNNKFHSRNNSLYRDSDISIIEPSGRGLSIPQPSQFVGTHILKLKKNDNGVGDGAADQERLYTQDNSQIDDHRSYSPRRNFQQSSSSHLTHYDESSKHGNISFDKDDNSINLENERPIAGNENYLVDMRTGGLYKKTLSPIVTKTMLEPKNKIEKFYAKINLEHKDNVIHPIFKGNSDNGNSLGHGTNETNSQSIKPLEFIRIVQNQKQAGDTPIIPIVPRDRTFAEILQQKSLEIGKEENSLCAFESLGLGNSSDNVNRDLINGSDPLDIPKPVKHYD